MTHAESSIAPNDTVPPVEIPKDHVGPVVIPGTNRQVWWTGRVAIGLRYERRHAAAPLAQSGAWVQQLMLSGRR